MSEGNKTSVIHIIDDDPNVLTTLKRTLSSAKFSCCSYETGTQFLEATVESRDCVITDIHLPDMNGIDLLNAMSARGHTLPTLVITGYATVELAVHAMKAGAIDFLAKPFVNADLFDKVNACVAIGHMRMAEYERRRAAVDKLAALSKREVEVLDQVIGGRTNHAIGEVLGISIKTVEAHRSRIMGKTGALSLVDLTRLWDGAKLS